VVKVQTLKDFRELPQDIQKIILEDLDTAFENRVETMKRVLKGA